MNRKFSENYLNLVSFFAVCKKTLKCNNLSSSTLILGVIIIQLYTFSLEYYNLSSKLQMYLWKIISNIYTVNSDMSGKPTI